MLQPLRLADKQLFDWYALCDATRLSSYAFAPLYIWRELLPLYWTIIDERFCLFANQDGDIFMPIMPMDGEPSEESIRGAFALMLDTNRNQQIARIENVPAEQLPFFQRMGFNVVLKGVEYLYETNALIGLKGNRYKSKRAAYNTFFRNHPSAKLVPYQPNDFADCLDLYALWQENRRATSDDPIYCAMLEDSLHAHRIGLMNARESGLVGRVIRVNGALKGYTFGYPLNDAIFCVLFEVTHPQIKGLAQFIYREFCREHSAYRWVSAMDDSGLENLKRVKRSYRPAELIASYNVTMKVCTVQK